MITQEINALLAVISLLLAGCLVWTFYRMNKIFTPAKPPTIEDYLFKIFRITGSSEYDIFCKSAENWPISSDKIDDDFKRYLSHQSIPYYVNDFIRKNQKQIDDLNMPQF